jgi:hypothetical protein
MRARRNSALFGLGGRPHLMERTISQAGKKRARSSPAVYAALPRSFAGLFLGVLFAIFFGALSSAQGQSGGSTEYNVKAAFLFHFAQFVEWPAEAFKDVAAPLTYCTIGDDPFRGVLDQALNGKTVGAHPLRVAHLREPNEALNCQVLFLGAAEKKRFGEALAGVNHLPVLTVGETEHFVDEGGIIGFCLEENKIRFEVNMRAATKAKLKISAKLLALAKTVIVDPNGG